MKVYVIMAVQDQPDTRVDHGAVIKHVICVVQEVRWHKGLRVFGPPTKKQQQSFLRKWAKEQEEDIKDFWVEIEESKLV